MNDKPTMTNLVSDWERVKVLTDEQIDTSDIPPLSETFFRRARVRLPKSQVAVVAVPVDVDVLEWFKAQGEDYMARMNAALRIYAEAHKLASVIQ
jgi:uncharacterized protein (DUF4415 family)